MAGRLRNTMDDLAVSVVIPTYNRARLVVRAVASALAAVAKGDVVIVVDDGSTDGTEAALAPYRDRIHYLRTANQGAGAAPNRGVREANTRFAEDLPLYEDWECFARLARAGRGAYLACETAWNHGHAGPRLTGADALTTTSTRIAMLNRIWGADAPFLATAGEQYRRVLARQHLLRARALIKAGRTSEARQELQRAGGGPFAYHALAGLPGPVARGIVTLGRALTRR
jgi:glycosyltransferase involved in cell wall biosynthesis